MQQGAEAGLERGGGGSAQPQGVSCLYTASRRSSNRAVCSTVGGGGGGARQGGGHNTGWAKLDAREGWGRT
jgi:hypothetical protein